MPPWLVGGVVSGLAAGAIGGMSAAEAQEAALAQARTAAKKYLDLIVPDPKHQQVLFEQYKKTGVLDPRLQQAFKQAESELKKVQVDPTLKSAQLTALRSLQDVADNGGRSLSIESDLQKKKSDVAASNRGRIGAIKANFAERGMGQPGGLEMAAQVSNAQNETQRESDASLDAAAQAKKAALGALQEVGTQSSRMRGQDFQQQAAVATAQDDINKFNTAALNTVNSANVKAQNDAARWNAENEQDISNRNTTMRNQEQVYNKNLQQQKYENELAKAQGSANALNGVANQYSKQGKSSADMWSGIGQGLTKTGAAAQLWSDRKDKNDEYDDEEGEE